MMTGTDVVAQRVVRLRPFRFVPVLIFCVLMGLAAWIGMRNDVGDVKDVTSALRLSGNVAGILAAMLLMLQLTFLVVVLVTIHSQILGGEVNNGWPRYFWFALLTAYTATFVWAKVVKPARLRKRHYVVTDVRAAARNVTSLTLKPAAVRRQ